MKFRFLVLSVFLTTNWFACKSDTNKPVITTTPESETKAVVQGISSAKLQNWTLVPLKQAGPITTNFTEDDLMKTFGEKNVIRQERNEMETMAPYMTSIVYPNTPNALCIRWKKGQDFKQIQSVRVETDSSNWKTTEGISTGTTLDELVKINGKDFKFHGFEWDYSGITNQWEGGKIDSNLVVYLLPSNAAAIYEKPGLLGNKQFLSNNKQAKKAGIKVGIIEIKF